MWRTGVGFTDKWYFAIMSGVNPVYSSRQIKRCKMNSQWWRFSDYEFSEVGEEIYIRPSPHARLQQYEWVVTGPVNRAEHRVLGDHYQSLLHLDLSSLDSILEWCRDYGLLGVLPQQTIGIVLAPRWMPIFEDHWPKVLTPYQVHYNRTAMGWRRELSHAIAGDDPVIGEMEPEDVAYVIDRFEDYINVLVDPKETVLQTPSCLIQPLFSYRYEADALGETIGKFFPDVAPEDLETYEYPLPLTGDYWRQYGEPLQEFQWAVGDFRNMVENLSHKDRNDQRSRMLAKRGEDQLNAMLASVNPQVWLDPEGSVMPEWTFPSLLAIFAVEVSQSLTRGMSIQHCSRPRCGKFFFSSQYNRAYCSDRCRNSEEKARQRNKRKGQFQNLGK